MNSHFCKVGRISAFQNQPIDLKHLESRYSHFIEEAYNLEHSDASKSDILYHEASKLKKRIFQLKLFTSRHLDAAL
ncbi:Lacal_2735 family protein [Psychroserpens sp. XS_ASV72]|uniref:Lacal_2735 family protein n=1 Tax=Psychroserpens sp. XS_ASV72 TaxID=3241293 RepID=UPI0035126B7E